MSEAQDRLEIITKLISVSNTLRGLNNKSLAQDKIQLKLSMALDRLGDAEVKYYRFVKLLDQDVVSTSKQVDFSLSNANSYVSDCWKIIEKIANGEEGPQVLRDIRTLTRVLLDGTNDVGNQAVSIS